MTYNSKIYHQQGGSELTVAAGGSINVADGGRINTTGILNLQDQGAYSELMLGSGMKIIWATCSVGPTGLPVNALPGSIFIRSDGSVSQIYINTGVNNAGSVWSATCVNAP
jgi:hypothetical protein